MAINEHRELVNLYKKWMHNGKSFLEIIIAHTEFLLTGEMGYLSKRQRQAVENIHHNGMYILECWHSNFLNFTSLLSESHEDQDNKEAFIEKFLEAFFHGREKAITYADEIKNLIDSLIGEDWETLDKPQRDKLQVIEKTVSQEIQCWNYPADYLTLRYQDEQIAWKAVSLHMIVQKAKEFLGDDDSVQRFELDLPISMPLIKGNVWLAKAIANFFRPLMDETEYCKMADTCKKIIARPSGKTHVLVQVRTGLELVGDAMDHPAIVLEEDTALAVADIIIKKYGSHVHVYPIENGVEFQFTLEVWENK